MTPQAELMIVAPVAAGRVEELRKLLLSMNHSPGRVNPENDLVPFSQFEGLHFARWAILDDGTLDDITIAYELPRVNYPIYLVFLADFDGSRADFLHELVQRADRGLRNIFAFCEDFNSACDLLAWMKSHDRPIQTVYWNWLGRTVRQVREERALWVALRSHLDRNASAFVGLSPNEMRSCLVKFVREEQQAGRLVLTPPEPTPKIWQLRNLWDLIWVPLVLVLTLPLALLYAPFFLLQVRMHERKDPVLAPRPNPEHVKKLQEIEDHDVVNQFTAFGSIKPGIFQRWSFLYFLWLINYTTRQFYNRARPVYVNTIHFARVVMLDGYRRLLFASSYDGSLDSYLDDFINKISFGLNVLFTHGIGYPTTRWIFLEGAKHEQQFKYYVRRHQMPTEVWYNAHLGLTCADMQRNSRIRDGLERQTVTDAEIKDWLRLF